MFRECIFNQGNKLLKLFAGLYMASVLIACTNEGIGGIVSMPRVTDADNDQVVFIGDSIYAASGILDPLGGGIQGRLEDKAGETFRNYAVSGAQLFGGSTAQSIPEQFDEALADNPNIDLVVGDGGGNDILLPAVLLDPHKCKTRWYQFGNLSTDCKDFIDGLYVEGVALLESYTQFGVQNAIVTGYYYTKLGIVGNLDLLEEAVDYGNATLKLACDGSPIPCTFINPTGVIKNRDIIIDGIHPKASASKKIADLIWPVMEPLL